MKKNKQKNGKETDLVRVKKEDKDLLQQIGEMLASKNGHKPSNPEVIHYLLTHFEDDDIERGVIRIFDSIIPDLEFLFKKYNFSQNKADHLIGEIAFFKAIILQQVGGSLPVESTYNILRQVPSAVKTRIKNEKQAAAATAEKLRKATPEVVP